MPLRRNPLFVGRDADLRTLAAAFKGGGAAAITTGIGGVGKTQLASEFTHRYGQFFMGVVFWLSFALAESARLAYSRVKSIGDGLLHRHRLSFCPRRCK
jgi:hypothetical protein